ncbi:MAG: type IV secretory system conjugative DNA transfer family protein [Clostridia bacterium]|nr:type IV secretory system conjugative DNA transfer family protein [Clostridia bacterium]
MRVNIDLSNQKQRSLNNIEKIFWGRKPLTQSSSLGKTVDAMPKTKDGHILAVGSTNSGKTSCFVIPALRRWSGRVFCIDIKGELYEHTQKQRTNIKVFDPLSESTYGFDPFEALSKTKNKAPEAEAIAAALIPMSPDVRERFWLDSARNLLTGCILHFHREGKTFLETIKAILTPAAPKSDFKPIRVPPFARLIEDIYENTKSEEARKYISAFVGLDDKPMSSIYTELSRHIARFVTDKDIVNCLSQEKRISPDDLENGHDIYICVPEYRLEQWRSLLTLMTSQFMRNFEKRPDLTETPILFMLDEFARLGKIEGIVNAFATLRSKKITICAVVQSLAQIDLIYGEPTRRVIVDNCSYIAIFAVTDATSQEYFSCLIGGKYTWNPSVGWSFPLSVNANISRNRDPLIYPEQLATLNFIIALMPDGVFRLEKIPFFFKRLEQKALFVTSANDNANHSYKLTDEEWKQVEPLLPPQRTGQKGKPPKSHRLMIDAILWRARVGTKWSELPEEYGSYKTVNERFRRWYDSGLLKNIFDTLGAVGDYEKLVRIRTN